MRITDEDQLQHLGPSARRQLREHLESQDIDEPGAKVFDRQKVNRSEEDDGIALTKWMDLLLLPNGLQPGLFWHHVPNGLARTKAMGGIFKAQGLRKGWPDYGLDIPLGQYHGFRLELKRLEGPKPTKEQLDHLANLESMGYKCAVAWGFDDAKEQIEQYLDLAN